MVPFNDDPFQNLADALRERLSAIGDEASRRDPDRHMARLQAVSEKIDRLVIALPGPIDSQLDHFLRRKSYDKALEMLDARARSRAAQ
jgi:hypothetical protein